MKLKYNFVFNEVNGQHVAVAVGGDAIKYKNILLLNAVGKYVFDQLKCSVSLEELNNKVISFFDGDEKEIIQQVSSFIAELDKLGLLES